MKILTAKSSARVFLTVAVCLCLSRSAFGVGELNGRIEGTILEADTGAPIPGANVVATSPALIGEPLRTTSDENGRFVLVELPPGTYTLDISYSGLKPLQRRLVVRQGESAPIRIEWSPELAQQETTVVVEERHLTRPDSTETGTVLSLDTQNRIASGRSYQNITQQVAGVSGGNNPDVKGANLIQNRYLVDGLDTTDPTTNTFSSNINFDSLSSVAVLTGGFEAQYNAIGAIVNLISAAGSDEYHVDTSFYANHYKLSASTVPGPALYEGDKAFNDTPRPPTSQYQGNINVSGPILRHQLWFNVSFEYSQAHQSQPPAPPLNLQAPSRVPVIYRYRGKLTWAPSAQHRITLSSLLDPGYFDNNTFNGAQVATVTPLAAVKQNQNYKFPPHTTVYWEYFPTENISTKVQAGFLNEVLQVGPQGKLGSLDFNLIRSRYPSDANSFYDYLRPSHTNGDDAPATVWYNSATNQVDERKRLQLDLSLSLRARGAGYHDAQVGIQNSVTWRSRYIERTGDGTPFGFPGYGLTYSDRGGGRGEAGLCDEPNGRTAGCFERTFTPPNTTAQQGFSIGPYIQDRWKVTSWLTLLPGLRFDYGHTNVVDPQTDPPNATVSNLYGFGPRFGALFDVTGDQKTIFQFSYGRSNEVLSLLAAANASPVPVATVQRFNQATKVWEVNRTTGGPAAVLFDPNNHTPMHSDEILLAIRRELGRGTVGAIEYTFKSIQNIWDNIDVNTMYDPTGTRVVGYRDPTKPNPIFLFTRPDNQWVRYQGVDFIVESRPSPAWDFYGSYTLSFKYGPGIDELGQLGFRTQNVDIRQAPLFSGYAPGDIRHQIKFHGSYTTHGFTFGPNLTYVSGELVRYALFNVADPRVGATPAGNLGNILRGPLGTEPGTPNDPNSLSEFRLPDRLTVNLRLQYDFYEVLHQHFFVIADFFNLLNASSATAVNNTAGPNFGLVSSRQQPFQAQFALRYLY